VACCPGGTASNVICYLAKANVALSVLLTMCSTLVAVLRHHGSPAGWPGAWLPVDAWALFRSMLVVVLLPLVCGMAVNTALGRMRKKSGAREGVDRCVGPLFSVAGGGVDRWHASWRRRKEIAAAALELFLSVFLLHVCGFFLGYVFAWAAGCAGAAAAHGFHRGGHAEQRPRRGARDETFPAPRAGPVPAAISAVYHCIIGSALAAWWRRKG
jgi:bile acid:Na+ symporter, BASS family